MRARSLRRLWASVDQPQCDVIRAALAEALKRDPYGEKRWIALFDGDRKLERWVRRAAKEFGVKNTIGLDMIHAPQYLWKAAVSAAVVTIATQSDIFTRPPFIEKV